MKATSALRSTTLLVCATLALSACKGGGEPGLPDAPSVPDDPSDGFDRVTSDPIDGLPEHFSAYFVESFDLAAVRAVRKAARFAEQTIRLSPIFEDHPVYDGNTDIDSNAYAAARVDYAHSVGLTGAGQTIAVIDSAIRTSHDEFAGKTVTVSSGSAFRKGDNWHGTGVAAIAAGSGDSGLITGVAPNANLYSGEIDFEGSITYGQLSTYAEEARELRAIALNNSWGFTEADGSARKASGRDLSEYFGEYGGLSGYIQSLKNFAGGTGSDSTGGVIVWAAPNDYHIDSINIMNALPLVHTELEKNWLAVINVIPEYDEQRITSGTRVSGACLEAARYCIGAQGYIQTAYSTADDAYSYANGTSFAAPQVSGGLALLAEAFPNLDASQLRDRMLVTADNGWFEHHNEMEFAPGLSHGYSEEFGHGFMDLRAALLPIGEMTFSSASGETLVVGRAAVAGGRMSGDAIGRSLAKTTVLATDHMAGDFAVGGEALAASSSTSDTGEGLRARMAYADLDYSRESLTSAIRRGDGRALLSTSSQGNRLDAIAAFGSASVPLFDTETAFKVEAIVPTSSNGAYGIGMSHSLDLGRSALDISLTSLHQEGSMMGIVAPGHEDTMRTQATGIALSYAAALDDHSALRLTGEFGSASGPGAGLIDGFENVRYDSLGLSLDRRDVGVSGSALSLFARQPIALSDGDAQMTLASGRSAGGDIIFSSMEIDLAPAARQADLGFEYVSPIGRAANMSFGVTRSLNAGNVSGEHETAASIGVQIRM